MYPIKSQNENITITETLFEMSDGVKLYTRITAPAKGEKFPIVFMRSPYAPVRNGTPVPCEEEQNNEFIKNGYAVVFQHCRGKGDSEGECIPDGIKERTDALETLDIIRGLPIYNGEIFITGGSYLATVHLMYLSAKPKDIKGAALAVETDRLYFHHYQNGCCYYFCNVPWFASMLSRKYPNYKLENNLIRPYKDIPKRVFGEDVKVVSDRLMNDEYNEFWQNDPRTNVVESLEMPVLFIDGWFDFFLEGMFDMWDRLPQKTKEKSAFVVGPWGHATQVSQNAEYPLAHGNMPSDLIVKWFNSIRNKVSFPYAEYGKVHYYSIGNDTWETAQYPSMNTKAKRLYFEKNHLLSSPGKPCKISYQYNPDFRHNKFKFGNIYKGAKADQKDGIISFYSDCFEKEAGFFGKIRFSINVQSDCEDTAFFFRVYLTENGEDFNLTQTITSLSAIDKNYIPGETIRIDIETPPIAFTVKRQCGIRVDISSDGGIYVPHANVRGHWAEVEQAKIAVNTLVLDDAAFMELPEMT